MIALWIFYQRNELQHADQIGRPEGRRLSAALDFSQVLGAQDAIYIP